MPGPLQTEFDWTRAEQLGLIDRAVIPRFVVVDGVAERLGCTSGVIKSVLRSIDSFGRGREAWPSVPTLAKHSGASERSTKRAIAALVKLSVLCVERRWRGTATVNHYRIVWSEIALLEKLEARRLEAREEEVSVGPILQTVGPNLQTVGPKTSDRGAKLAHKPLRNCLEKTNQQERLLTPTLSPEYRGEGANEHMELVQLVFACGVKKAQAAIAGARAIGLSNSDIRERTQRWHETSTNRDPGVLFNWLAIRGSFEACGGIAEKRVASSEQRGDAMGREERERMSLRCRIMRAGRAAGAPEDEIEKRLQAAGV